MIQLQGDQAVFIGFKLETGLRRQIEALVGPDKKYVSADDSNFLRICKLGDVQYVGKLIEERLSTDRIQDIQRNVVSILQRLFPEERFPREFLILPAGGESASVDAEDPDGQTSAGFDRPRY
jgi:hypothetical protein